MDTSSAVFSRKRTQISGQKRQNKPLIEKRRRARINDCLSQLQTLVLKAKKVESPRPGKLEKADILEMTVDYIKKNRNPSADGHGEKPEVKMQYTSGYERCIQEVVQFLDRQTDITVDMKERISKYCSTKLRENYEPSEQTELKPEKMEEDSQESDQSECDSDADTSGKESDKPEVRRVNQTTAYVAPLQQTNSQACQVVQGSVVPTPVCSVAGVQVPVQSGNGQIKLICGGDIWILLDPNPSMTPEGVAATKQTQCSNPQDTVTSKRSETEPPMFSLAIPNVVPHKFPIPILPFHGITTLNSTNQGFAILNNSNLGFASGQVCDVSKLQNPPVLLPTPTPCPSLPNANSQPSVDQCAPSMWRPW